MNSNNDFTITFIDKNIVKNISFKEFGKDRIYFGRSEDNDIVLASPLVSSKHGYFEIIDNNLVVVDLGSTNGIYINNKKINSAYLHDGDSIKIDNVNTPLEAGVTFLFSKAKSSKWQEVNINKKIIIGRSNDSDIVVSHVLVSLRHLCIYKSDSFYIETLTDSNLALINGIPLKGKVELKERDIIILANAKIIYTSGRILYQIYESGARVDAIDIVKTVKVKGVKRDITNHVNFCANPGEFIAFVGGSGAGKSTFMNCISGVDFATSGNVYINGSNLVNNYASLKNMIGYVPQEDIVFTDLTLIDMLMFASELRMSDDATYEERKNRVEAVLEIVELTERKTTLIKNLSGGQRKRASIAVELIADPNLFFLDEPTSGLDPGTERNIMKTLRKMADSGKTIILVTHTTLNLHLCDKIAFFGNGGRLCFFGTPSDTLKFFNVTDFVDIYNIVSKDAEKISETYNKSNYFIKAVEYEDNSKKAKEKNEKSFLRQLVTLSRRYLKVTINNKQQLMLLLIQAPLIGYLLSLVVTKNIFNNYTETKTILFALATASIWLGLLNSIQEICKERVILNKEYMANLRLGAYLGSKVIVLSLLALVQTLLVMATFTFFVIDTPIHGIMMHWNIEMCLTCFLTIVSASSIGLVVSSLSKNSSVALSFAPLLLVPQLLFSGILFSLKGVINNISYFVLCRWSVEAFGTTNDLNAMYDSLYAKIPGYTREEETFFEFTKQHFMKDISIIVIMAVILLFICYFILRKQCKKK